MFDIYLVHFEEENGRVPCSEMMPAATLTPLIPPCQKVFYFVAIEGIVSARYIFISLVAAVSTRVLVRVGKVANETSLNFSVSDHVKLFAMRHADWALHLLGTCVCVFMLVFVSVFMCVFAVVFVSMSIERLQKFVV